jgi:hypothetical protein
MDFFSKKKKKEGRRKGRFLFKLGLDQGGEHHNHHAA